MKIEGIEFRDAVLSVKCSGTYGIGSEGTSSSRLVTAALKRWMQSHPTDIVEQVVVDYRVLTINGETAPCRPCFPFLVRGSARLAYWQTPRTNSRSSNL